MSKQEEKVRDATDGRRFMVILSVAVVALVVLLYLAMR